MPNRLGTSAKREKKADEKQQRAEEKFNERAAAMRRKFEKKAQRLSEKKTVAGHVAATDETEEILLDIAPAAATETEVVAEFLSTLNKEPTSNTTMDAMPIDVSVQCMTGEEYWLTPLPETSVADFKVMLSEEWGIPSMCQQLLIDCTLLRDSDLLCHHMECGNRVLKCTAIVVLGELRDPCTLAKLALQGCEGVLNAVYDALGSQDDGTRYQMFVEVRKLAKRDDVRAIQVFEEIMSTARLPSFRAEILGSLACVGSHCDHVKCTIVAQMKQPEACVRVAALQAFSHFAANASQRDIYAVAECLEDELEDVRFQAAQTLANIAAYDHADVVVTEVKKRFRHANGGVRRVAVQALSQLIVQGHGQSDCEDNAFLQFLADTDPDVRVAAVQAIDCGVALRNQQTFQALVVALFDPNGCVRQSALRAVKRFEQKDVELLIFTAKTYLTHKNAMIRCIAAEALGTMNESLMDEDVTSGLNRLMSDRDALVRSTAARVLRRSLQ